LGVQLEAKARKISIRYEASSPQEASDVLVYRDQ
jgi:hypothetical protein